jgi:ketosteroid isomerase-like protein
MSEDNRELERRGRAYVAAVEAGVAGEELAAFYHPDAVLYVLPNALQPAGSRRSLPDILADAERGRAMLTRQMFDIATVTQSGDRLVLEMTWTGFLSAPLGMTKAGDPIRAHVVQVLEFEDGLIIRQRTYDCYQPF